MSTTFVHTQINVETVLFQTTQFTVSTVSMSKTDLFQIIQFSTSTHLSSIWPIDRALSGDTILGQRGYLGAMAIKVYSAFFKALPLLEPHH